MIPEFFHRQTTAEPAMFGAVAFVGSGITLGLAEVASTPAEYGAVFIAFLVFLGTGVMGIVSFTAVYIAKAVSKAVADLAGGQALKLFRLPEPEVITSKLAEIVQNSSKRDEEIMDRLETMSKTLDALNRTTALLNQELQHQVKRSDRIEDHVFQRNQS